MYQYGGPPLPDNEDLLSEIRENYDRDLLEWSDIRDAGRDDMLMIADGPWPQAERVARADRENPRPCESFDELGQYLNQFIGDLRQNQRAVKVTPTGNGANDATAEKRAGMIRQIEYDSNAQTAYQTGCENMIKRSYGFIKLGSRYADPAGGFDQELYIGTVPNPDTILVDPFAKEPDWSDMTRAYEIDSYSEKEFTRKWPNAEMLSFGADQRMIAPAWISDRIQVAAYWKLSKTKRRQIQLDGGSEGPTSVYVDQLPKGSKVSRNEVAIPHPDGWATFAILNSRQCEDPLVTQYITNGVEILETNPQKWIEIPIIPLFGPEEFVDAGNGTKRRLLSMVRKARGAYMGYCYARTGEIEVLGRAPKIGYGGYEGQFDTKTPWDKINKLNLPYFEVKATLPGTGSTVLPIPQRADYDPPIQSYEMAAASFKAAIQSAMSVAGMSNGRSGQNLDARSGKALEKLNEQEAQGTFVFISNYERGLARCGRMLEQGLTWCYCGPREAGMRSPADVYSSEKINQVDPSGNPVGFHTSHGDHATTISVGPSEQSERDAADDFVDTLFATPGMPQAILSLAVRLKHLGPIGDEIAEALDPKGAQPPPSPQVQQQLQQIPLLQQELQKAQFALQAKLPEIASKEKLAAADLDFKREQLAVEASIGAAKIGSAQAIERLDIETDTIAKERGMTADAIAQQADHAHELAMQQGAQQHQADMQSSAQGADAAAQGIDQAADAGSQARDHAHKKDMQGSQQVAAAGLQESAQDAAADAAAKAPKPKP